MKRSLTYLVLGLGLGAAGCSSILGVDPGDLPMIDVLTVTFQQPANPPGRIEIVYRLVNRSNRTLLLGTNCGIHVEERTHDGWVEAWAPSLCTLSLEAPTPLSSGDGFTGTLLLPLDDRWDDDATYRLLLLYLMDESYETVPLELRVSGGFSIKDSGP